MSVTIFDTDRGFDKTLKTSATVTDSEYIKDTVSVKRRRSSYYNISVRYEVDGKEYNEVLMRCPKGRTVGSTLMVAYNPENPEEIYSTDTRRSDTKYTIMGWIVGFAALIKGGTTLYPYIEDKYYRNKRKKEQEEKPFSD